MSTNYGIRLTASGLWLSIEHRWARNPIAARWFKSRTEAELVGLRELHDRRGDWTVEPIPLSEAMDQSTRPA